jgi:hypothetical protein
MSNYEEIKKLLKASRELLGENKNGQLDQIKEQYGIKNSNLISEADGNITNKINVMQGIKRTIDDETQGGYETAETNNDDQKVTKSDKKKTYRVSGGLITIHGKDAKNLQLTTEDKKAFQESMDEFINDVAELVDFNKLNLYPNNVEWSGKITELDVDFFFSIAEPDGLYINGTMIRLDTSLLEIVNKLQSFYEKFKTKWSRVIAARKKTPNVDEQ